MLSSRTSSKVHCLIAEIDAIIRVKRSGDGRVVAWLVVMRVHYNGQQH